MIYFASVVFSLRDHYLSILSLISGAARRALLQTALHMTSISICLSPFLQCLSNGLFLMSLEIQTVFPPPDFDVFFYSSGCSFYFRSVGFGLLSQYKVCSVSLQPLTKALSPFLFFFSNVYLINFISLYIYIYISYSQFWWPMTEAPFSGNNWDFPFLYFL